MAGQFEDRVVLVTGGSSGIGRATALAFAERGARVVIADVVVDGGEETVRMIKQAGGEAVFVKTDVSQATEVEALINKTIQTYGRLDYAVNNAGIEGENAPTADCSEENWDRTIDINLKGVWLCMKYEIPEMLRQGSGAIVNMASVAGLVGTAGLPAYGASKHGVVGLTKSAALEYAASGLRINAVCPAVIRTPMIDRVVEAQPELAGSLAGMHPLGRIGEPAEVAGAVVWLCSDEASFVTGHSLVVDGGMVAR